LFYRAANKDERVVLNRLWQGDYVAYSSWPQA